MTNKIDISKLEVKKYAKGSYLIIKYIYKNDTNTNQVLTQKTALEKDIEIDIYLIQALLKNAKSNEKNLLISSQNSKLFKITINGYAVWLN